MLTILKVTYSMFPGLTKRGFAKNLKISFQFVVLFAFIFSLHRTHNSIKTCCYCLTQSIFYNMRIFLVRRFFTDGNSNLLVTQQEEKKLHRFTFFIYLIIIVVDSALFCRIRLGRDLSLKIK
jgi:hypothetical protein